VVGQSGMSKQEGSVFNSSGVSLVCQGRLDLKSHPRAYQPSEQHLCDDLSTVLAVARSAPLLLMLRVPQNVYLVRRSSSPSSTPLK
jgi:hypothetical protein